METPFWVSCVQAGGMIVSISLMALGVRRGQMGRSSGFRYIDPLAIDMRLIWVGISVWTVTTIFNVAAACVWLSATRVVLSGISVIPLVFTIWMAMVFPTRAQERESEQLLEDFDEVD